MSDEIKDFMKRGLAAQKAVNEIIDNNCADCGAAGSIETEITNDSFIYGVGPDAVQLHVTLPVRHCKACDFRYCDWESEDIMAAAINKLRRLP